jgi:hypothetical protein
MAMSCFTSIESFLLVAVEVIPGPTVEEAIPIEVVPVAEVPIYGEEINEEANHENNDLLCNHVQSDDVGKLFRKLKCYFLILFLFYWFQLTSKMIIPTNKKKVMRFCANFVAITAIVFMSKICAKSVEFLEEKMKFISVVVEIYVNIAVSLILF